MPNSLNLIFGPGMPPELEKVGLAFVSAPFLSADTSIANLPADRYVSENYGHLADDIVVYDDPLVAGKQVSIQATIDPFTIGGRFSSTGESSYNSTFYNVPESESTVNLKVLNLPIKLAGIQLNQADSWFPLIQPGVVWRKYVVTALEPATGWIKQSGAVEGDELYLIYAVPEFRYKPLETANSNFPSNNISYANVIETASITGTNKISFRGNPSLIKNIYVNGTKQYSGDLDLLVSTVNSYVTNIDLASKTLSLSKRVLPDDYITLEYLTPNTFYPYSGFRDRNNTWYAFDANPEYGHWIGDDQTQSLRNSSNALSSQVTIYAIPTAYLKYSFQDNPEGGDNLGTIQLQFKRACEYGETHFIRHIVNDSRLEQLDSRVTGSSPRATWGHAVLGLNYYNEFGASETDIFSSIVPSMLPLSKVVLAAPASVKSVATADIRLRGGGIPDDYQVEAIEAAGGLDQVRGYWDMATWSGAAVQEGGVIEIRIDESILKTDPEDLDPATFLPEEIHEIVKTTICPGVDFRIIYTTVD